MIKRKKQKEKKGIILQEILKNKNNKRLSN